MNQSRNLALDVFKALGIIYLIILHQIYWTFIVGKQPTFAFDQATYIFYNLRNSGLHPLGYQIPLIAGASFYYYVNKSSINFNVIFKRAVFLILLGYVMNFCAWGFEDLLDWDVLQFIGTAMLLIYPLLRIRSSLLRNGILIGISIASIIYSEVFPLEAFKNAYWYIIVFGVSDGEHYWPMAPWFSLIAAGAFLGNVLKTSQQSILKCVMFAGGVLMLISILMGDYYHPFVWDNLNNAWGVSYFKPAPCFVLGIIGFSFLFIPLIHLLLIKKVDLADKLSQSFLMPYAHGILGIYLVSIIVGFRITYIFSSVYEDSFNKALMFLWFLAIFNLVLAYVVGRVLMKLKRRVK